MQDIKEEKFIENLLVDELQLILKKYRKLIGLLNHSAILTEEISKYAKLENLKSLAVPQIIDIRWNSLYMSLDKFFQLETLSR